MSGRPTVSVVIAAFADERWHDLAAAVHSVQCQTYPPSDVVVVVDHNPGLLARASVELPEVRVVPNASARGASGARNTGTAASAGEIVAFLDDDVVASPDWLERLVGHFDDGAVLGVGGRVDARWATGRPAWFPREFDWVVGASYLGMPVGVAAVRNVWSESMAVRREVLQSVGGFRAGFGRVGTRARPEDTDLCLRATRSRPGGRWVYDPTAGAGHKVPAARETFGFFVRRCYQEGRGKADLWALDGAAPATATERSYATRVLPAGVLAGLAESARGDPSGVVRSAVISCGFLTTAVGFAVGRTLFRPSPRSAATTAPGADAAAFRPVQVAEVELARPLPDLPPGRRSAWVLVRLHGEPLGSLRTPLPEDGLPAQDLADLIWSRLRRPITERLVGQGLAPPERWDAAAPGLDPARSPYLRERREVLAAAPRISVVVCTRDRPERLRACLEHVSGQDYPSYEVVVVDNAPCSDAVRDLVTHGPERPPWRYVLEPRPGLSRARNAGVAAAGGEIVAFLDDDEAPDRHWLAEIARGFARAADIGCVTGLVLPGRLDTPAQDWFERLGGHSKGRGFEPAVFSRDGAQSPLYPLPPFGVGANMAFRRRVLRALGGFDVALGAGTPTRSGEDTLAITQVLLSGYRVAYQPSAFVWHDHRAETAELARQLRGYGVGLTAYYAALLWRHPAHLVPLLRLVPTGLHDLRGDTLLRTAWLPDVPVRLTLGQRGGLLAGPVAYAHSRRVQRRLGGST